MKKSAKSEIGSRKKTLLTVKSEKAVPSGCFVRPLVCTNRTLKQPQSEAFPKLQFLGK
jgi:hypothetical protein